MNYKGHLVYELLDLTEKLTRLNMFLDNEKKNELDKDTIKDLQDQREAMMTYHSILTCRVIKEIGGIENE